MLTATAWMIKGWLHWTTIYIRKLSKQKVWCLSLKQFSNMEKLLSMSQVVRCANEKKWNTVCWIQFRQITIYKVVNYTSGLIRWKNESFYLQTCVYFYICTCLIEASKALESIRKQTTAVIVIGLDLPAGMSKSLSRTDFNRRLRFWAAAFFLLSWSFHGRFII